MHNIEPAEEFIKRILKFSDIGRGTGKWGRWEIEERRKEAADLVKKRDAEIENGALNGKNV